ncbi:MAG: TatD family hydrolase [Alteromonadales bacterium]|nr:TatD family hydrolase [Alteromonadales bacterium]
MFIDSHCHLDFPCFSSDLESILKAIVQAKITKLIIPATQASSWQSIEKLSKDNLPIYYALGIHPHFLSSFQTQDLPLLKEKLLNRNHKCIALGEIGLDKFAQASQSQQELVFIEQLKIAEELKLPIILHCVKKQDRIITLLKEHNFKQGGVYHAFSGSLEVAETFIKLGFKLGVGGVITYPNSTKTRQTVTKLPIESMVLETDAPDMSIYQQQTAHNDPLNIQTIFDSLLSLRHESKSQLATQLYQNTFNIFPLCDD